VSKVRVRHAFTAALCVVAAACAAAPAASAAVPNEDPIFVFEPQPPKSPFEPTVPLPAGDFAGPCGMTVDTAGNFYIADYYHHTVDVYNGHAKYSYGERETPPTGSTGYITQLSGEDPEDGPCGLALDGSGNLFVNNYHRNVVKFGPWYSFGGGTLIAGHGVDSTYSTGVDVDPANEVVYVDSRTYVAAFHDDGTPVLEGGNPLRIGIGSLVDGYGIAYSRYPGTLGRLYVPDAATNTVKVYDPATDTEDPVAEIDGSETPRGAFVSLRDATVAVDRVSGEVYVVDNLQPRYTEKPNAAVYVFDAAGSYEGHLKYTVGDALPVGLAVDNSGEERDPLGTQGRVYVTSGNTEPAAIYGYHPEAATTEPLISGVNTLQTDIEGSGVGLVVSSHSSLPCADSCRESVRGGTVVTLTAEPTGGSAFAGWSGACSGNDPVCTIAVERNLTAHAHFSRLAPDGGTGETAASPPTVPARTASAPPAGADPAVSSHRRHLRRRHRHARRHRRIKHHRARRG
jgi:hypothetical protein